MKKHVRLKTGLVWLMLVVASLGFAACEGDNDTGEVDTAVDQDQDQITGDNDNCPEVANEDQADDDGDGIGNACDDDLDNDGVLNDDDNCPTDANEDQADLDGDDQGDVCDDTPTLPDADEDGIVDEQDNCPDVANEDQADLDEDGVGDACDEPPDTDEDGIVDADDNCPEIANEDQADLDEDGIGDTCDDDIDGDNIVNDDDNCNVTRNAEQADLDEDGTGDACDEDRDGDNVLNDADNCPDTSNEDQADLDEDGTGNLCDDDIDGDNILNDADNCQEIANEDQADLDEDSVGDLCDEDRDGDSVLNDDDNCPDVNNAEQADLDEDGTGNLCDEDRDGDNVLNDDDNCPDTSNEDQADLDEDNLGNLCDEDIDGDNVLNDADNCPNVNNAEQSDRDEDSLGDACDDDLDGDGVLNDDDNCIADPNPDQIDLNEDGAGDVCDDDIDGDNILNDDDNCPNTINEDQADLDEDGTGDTCDDDRDGDSVLNDDDNCPDLNNIEQVDLDEDDTGDLCDDDRDGDNVLNDDDNCPDTSNEDQADLDEDSVGDLCDEDRDGDNVLNDADNCQEIANEDQVDLDEDSVGDLCDEDRDGDEVLNDDDNCPDVNNAEQADLDEDNIGDACDGDRDGDNVLNDDDNCPDTSNEDQADLDEDNLGNLCDDDLDGDEVLNDIDNCPDVNNTEQADLDEDNTGDLCDDDIDGDNILNDADNCPVNANEDQADLDEDGTGDLCDDDVDGDDVDNEGDNCLTTPNPEQSNIDEDDLGDACDDDIDGDNVLNNEDNCPIDANAEQSDEDEDGLGDVCDDCAFCVCGDEVCQEGETVFDCPQDCNLCPEALPLPNDGLAQGNNTELPNNVEPNCGSGGGSEEVYTFDSPGRLVSIEFNTFESNYDTVLHIYRDACADESRISCNDDAQSTQSQIILTDQEPGTFQIVVDGYSTRTGDYNLAVRGTLATGEPCDPDLTFLACEEGVCEGDLETGFFCGTLRDCTDNIDVDDDEQVDEDAACDAPPIVTCPEDIQSPPNNPVTLSASAEDDQAILRQTWSMVQAPNQVPLTETDGPDTGFTPTQLGIYTLRYTAVDNNANAVACEVNVEVRLNDCNDGFDIDNDDQIDEDAVCDAPPTVTCPEDLITIPNINTSITATSEDEDGIVSETWSLEATPEGARVNLNNFNGGSTNFTPPIPGLYTLRYTVTDTDANTVACEVNVEATLNDCTDGLDIDNDDQIDEDAVCDAPPTITCPDDIVTVPELNLALSASAEDDGELLSQTWTLVESPALSTTTLNNPESPDINFLPVEPGNYRLRYTVIDNDANAVACEVNVSVQIGDCEDNIDIDNDSQLDEDANCIAPPVVSCPDDLTLPTLEQANLVATVTDDGEIVRHRWQVIEGPEGSDAQPNDNNSPETSFIPLLAGNYRMRYTALDNDTNAVACEFNLTASIEDDFRVELIWNLNRNPAEDGTDVDLHLLDPAAEAWFDDNFDCYYSNCIGSPLPWGDPENGNDDPRLDLDDTEGRGPENVNIFEPLPGETYRIGVHYYSDDGEGDSIAVIKVYCFGILQQTFGPVTLQDFGNSDDNEFWKVADVTFGDGACTINDLSQNGQPLIVIANEAQQER